MIIDSYSKIRSDLNFARRHGFFDRTIDVEEKIDGSQFSFFVDQQEGNLHARSKGREIDLGNPDGLFVSACMTIKSVKDKLYAGAVYRGEVLQKPRHNVLEYNRTPKGNVILFDVQYPWRTDNVKLSYCDKLYHAEELGLECVALLGSYDPGELTDKRIEELLSTKSMLGDVPIEGIVLKQHNCSNLIIDPNSQKEMMIKIVSDNFKEVANRKKSKRGSVNQGPAELAVYEIAARYATEARYSKAYQHLRDDGKLSGQKSDIGLICKEVVNDVFSECSEDISHELFASLKNSISKIILSGVPSWYTQKIENE